MKLWVKTKEFSEGKFLVIRRDGTIPLWPNFVIGARDPAAVAALQAYAIKAEQLGYDPEYVASVRELVSDFEAYRAAEGDGDPESPPHRTDDPNVIDAMSGRKQMVDVNGNQRLFPMVVRYDLSNRKG